MTNDPVIPQERFDYAVNIILSHEGGYSNDPDDSGGETNFGITQSDLLTYGKMLKLPINVKDLTRNEAEVFYKKFYWDKYNYNAINSLPIATKIFDMAVNMGAHEAHVLVQRALGRLGYFGYNYLPVDGIIGAHTIGAINEECIHCGEEELMKALITEAKIFYEYLVINKPHLKKFLNGWLERASWS